MISLYSGTPGSGKSVHLIIQMLNALRWGKHVIANFPIKFNKKEIKKGYEQRFHFWTNENITVDNLINFSVDYDIITKQKEGQVLIVIDEAGGRFNCREYSRSDRAVWIDFMSQHRKLGFDILLVAQNDRMLDRQIRGYIETEVKHRKVNNFGPFWIIPWPVFVGIEYWYTAKQKVESSFFIYRPSIGKRFDTAKLFSGFKLSAELLKKIEDKKEGREHKPTELAVPITAVIKEA